MKEYRMESYCEKLEKRGDYIKLEDQLNAIGKEGWFLICLAGGKMIFEKCYQSDCLIGNIAVEYKLFSTERNFVLDDLVRVGWEVFGFIELFWLEGGMQFLVMTRKICF